ncbi:MAG: hypothetical protein PWQ85_162 [Geotoga sp.]|jgi:probable phosphoglycerate mutase|nr:hypothetical protein [Geotoga sp.]
MEGFILNIYLVRHGITDWNKEYRWQGEEDEELNAEGINQAETVQKRFAGDNIKSIYSSTLKRAIKTAEIINRNHNLEINKLSNLDECKVGPFSGLHIDEVKNKYKKEFKEWSGDPWSNIEGMESLGDVQSRSVKAVKNIISKHEKDDKIIVVAHGLVIRTIISWVLKLPITSNSNFRIDNCSVSEVLYENNKFRLKSLNETWHLIHFNMAIYETAEERDLQ